MEWEADRRLLGYQLFNQFFDSQQIWLKTKGLQGQFLKMDVSEFQRMKIKLNVHADWERWLRKLLEVSQDYALVLPPADKVFYSKF